MSAPSLHSFASWPAFAVVLGALAPGVLGCSAQLSEQESSHEDSTEEATGEVSQPLVFGDDERRLVKDTENPEYSAVVRIVIDWQGQDTFCSGVLVGERHVLTAGHCVYDAERGGYAKSLTVTPGASEGEEPFGHSRTKKMLAHPKWVRGQDDGHSDRGFDLAVVELGEACDAGSLEMHAASDDELEDGDLVVTGYPADLGGRDMYTATGDLVGGAAVMEDVLIHTIDTFGGDSGAGISLDGQVVGLHVAHKKGMFAYNTGMRLTSDKVDWVNEQIERGL